MLGLRAFVAPSQGWGPMIGRPRVSPCVSHHVSSELVLDGAAPVEWRGSAQRLEANERGARRRLRGGGEYLRELWEDVSDRQEHLHTCRE
jgi:hypothetical protein